MLQLEGGDWPGKAKVMMVLWSGIELFEDKRGAAGGKQKMQELLISWALPVAHPKGGKHGGDYIFICKLKGFFLNQGCEGELQACPS